MVDEPVMERWLALEMSRFHRAFVAQPRPLGDLVAEMAEGREPAVATKGGELHRYDPAALRRIDAVLSPLARRRVRLPATFFVDKDLPDDVHVADEPVMDMLRALGEVPPSSQAREGKLWLGHVRARLIAERYPGAFQFVYF